MYDPLCKQERHELGQNFIQRMVMERDERDQIRMFVVILVPGAMCKMEPKMNPKIEEVIEYFKHKGHWDEGYHGYGTGVVKRDQRERHILQAGRLYRVEFVDSGWTRMEDAPHCHIIYEIDERKVAKDKIGQKIGLRGIMEAREREDDTVRITIVVRRL